MFDNERKIYASNTLCERGGILQRLCDQASSMKKETGLFSITSSIKHNVPSSEGRDHI